MLEYFDLDGDLVFCNDIGMLMTELSIEHKTEEWCLLIASESSRKKGCCPVLLLDIG